jgi:hypothetical protein
MKGLMREWEASRSVMSCRVACWATGWADGIVGVLVGFRRVFDSKNSGG